MSSGRTTIIVNTASIPNATIRRHRHRRKKRLLYTATIMNNGNTTVRQTAWKAMLHNPSSIQLSLPDGYMDNNLNAYPVAQSPPTAHGRKNNRRDMTLERNGDAVPILHLIGGDDLMSNLYRQLLWLLSKAGDHSPCNIPKMPLSPRN
jgi:hypothetical protein